MKRHGRHWIWALALILLHRGACVADDFLYVLATPPGQRSEIHWVPAKAPLTARVIVEDLDRTDFIHRHRDELWWWAEDRPTMGDLVGQRAESLPRFNNRGVSNIVRQGGMLYWSRAGQLGSFDLETGEERVLATSRATVQLEALDGDFFTREVVLFEDGTTGFRGLAVYEDRLYFGDGALLETIRLDGFDRRQVGSRDRGAGDGNGTSVLFGLEAGFDDLLRNSIEPAPRGLAVHDDRLIWVNEGAFWQMDLKTGDKSSLTGELPGSVRAMTVSDEAIYWIDDSRVWRRKHGGDEHEPLYELGETRFSAISVVTAETRPATMVATDHVEVTAEVGATYQLLISEDLESWSPNFVRDDLFRSNGSLSWFRPKLGKGNAPLVWHPRLDMRQAYFSAWQYDFGKPLDEDGDELPDYWEKRHFKDLSASADGDSNGDGLTHLEEARLFVGPNEIDADRDGLSNSEEVAFDPPLNPASNDTDGDSLTDGDEVNVYRSDPHSSDTDSDGFTDDFEMTYGGDLNEGNVVPPPESVLGLYAEDLMVHFDFEPSANGAVFNRGQLGGNVRVVGPWAYVARETDAGETSRALDLGRGDSVNVSHVETELSLKDLGFAADEPEITIALWLRTDWVHRGTLLSAVRTEGSEQAISLNVGANTRNSLIHLALSQIGSASKLSLTTRDAVDVGVWTHVAWTDGPDGRKIYTDGILRSSQVGRMKPLEGEPKLWLGAQLGHDGATMPFRGEMDDVRIYKRTLSEHAIKLLAR